MGGIGAGVSSSDGDSVGIIVIGNGHGIGTCIGIGDGVAFFLPRFPAFLLPFFLAFLVALDVFVFTAGFFLFRRHGFMRRFWMMFTLVVKSPAPFRMITVLLRVLPPNSIGF